MAAQSRCRRFVLGEWLYRSQHSSDRLYRSRFICVESVELAFTKTSGFTKAGLVTL